MRASSIAVILNTDGVRLDLAALKDLPCGQVVRAELASGNGSAVVAATVEHDCTASDLLKALRPWASVNGWSVTVAPLAGTC